MIFLPSCLFSNNSARLIDLLKIPLPHRADYPPPAHGSPRKTFGRLASPCKTFGHVASVDPFPKPQERRRPRRHVL
jgi:hypothetical protein